METLSFLSWKVLAGQWHTQVQCLTDMPFMTLEESLTGIGYAQQMATATVLGILCGSYSGFVS